MNKTLNKLFGLVTILVLFLSLPARAQTQAEIELAKQIARRQGYSDQQIEQMMKKRQGESGQNNLQKTQSIDRNAAVQGNNNVVMPGYGISGMQGAANAEINGMKGTGTMAEWQQLQLQQQIPQVQSQSSKQQKPSLIFGHDIFKNKNLNFIPSYNIPTPDNYKLSAGDEVVIDVWGATVTNITTEVTPEGNINIPDLGPVYINGQTVKEAEKNIKEYLSKIYSGISEPTPNTFVKLALGKIKSVTVNVVGEVVNPGSYTLPSLSTVASAMYLAGGPTDLGTIRDIKVYRKNKLVSEFDVYEFLQTGNFAGDIRLEDNDVIVVGPYSNVVIALGAVKRPMKYEMKNGEGLDKLLNYAGGFSDRAFDGSVHVDRIKGNMRSSFDINKKDFSSFVLTDGDIVTVNTNTDRYKNRVKIAGAVWRPGTYSISDSLQTIKQLIQDAGGLRDDAYIQKGYIVRLGESREKEQVSFSLENIILGGEEIKLMPDDSVQIFSIDSLIPKQTVSIAGEVNSVAERDGSAQTFDYRSGMTLGDLILMANGLTDAATLGKIEIARRVKHNPLMGGSEVKQLSDTIAVILHFNLLANPSDADFRLEPFDAVFVRRTALYKPQQAIRVEGEVNYPGTYVIEKNTVRLSDVIKKAEGFNKDAYIRGAKLTRMLTEEEFERLKVAMQIAKKQVADASAMDSLEIGDRFYIGINLEEAIKNPGSFADVVLRDNDIITVPKMNNTVKVSGAVFYPNTVTFNPRYRFKHYISNAGGYAQGAIKRKVYMVHMNGSVARRGSKDFIVQPGTEIIVPMKDMENRNRITLSEVLGIASSTASIAAMVVSISNMVK